MVTVETQVSGSQLGSLLARDSEEAAEALVALADGADFAELTDYLESFVLHMDGYRRGRLSELAEAVREALGRCER